MLVVHQLAKDVGRGPLRQGRIRDVRKEDQDGLPDAHLRKPRGGLSVSLAGGASCQCRRAWTDLEPEQRRVVVRALWRKGPGTVEQVPQQHQRHLAVPKDGRVQVGDQ